jgi:hypothetical protein
MAQDDPKTLVSTQWLKNNLKHPDLRVLDASWHLPNEDRNAFAEFEKGHIPGARFLISMIFQINALACRIWCHRLKNSCPECALWVSVMGIKLWYMIPKACFLLRGSGGSFA